MLLPGAGVWSGAIAGYQWLLGIKAFFECMGALGGSSFNFGA